MEGNLVERGVLDDPKAEKTIGKDSSFIQKWNRSEDFEAGADPDEVFIDAAEKPGDGPLRADEETEE